MSASHQSIPPFLNIFQSKSGAAGISKAQVLLELHFTLEQKERAVAANPYDALSREHIGILCQVCPSIHLLYHLNGLLPVTCAC